MQTNTDFSARVESAVAKIEERTDAEVVVVAAARSADYADLPASYASLAAVLTLAVMILLPFDISALAVFVDMVLVWVGVRVALDRPWFLSRLAGKERMRRSVYLAACAEFHMEAVHATHGRTGVLVYVSALEGLVEIIPDVGVEARIPRGQWAAASGEFSHQDVDHFCAGLAKVGEQLRRAVPRTDRPRIDLANAPRIRP